ncbi:Protein of unknown function (DUF1626) [Pyrobaculum oguniense TE7]|uniref:DUF3782 domain-containing protein n=1 Tax=Pyrobaculum oguniense (strain DSM 13380 / JCM 10595 / TE7) TaxID=698757 RepID=H6QA97_PYROT|nr:Protein of unknown function (DUF1626) [Pyrobaculum oguniense TE7]
MSLVRRALMEHPEITANALMAQVLYEVLAKIAPWERLATKEDIASVDARLDAVVERVEALEKGFAPERWAYYDAESYVYGYPAEEELDVVVHNGKAVPLEITSTPKRGDLPVAKRKAEVYERAAVQRADAVYVTAVYIHDRNPALVEAVANKMGIRLVKPESFTGEAGEP